MNKCYFVSGVRTLRNGTRQPDDNCFTTKEALLIAVADLRRVWDLEIFEVSGSGGLIRKITAFDENMNEVGSRDTLDVPLNYSTEYGTVSVREWFPDDVRKGHHGATLRLMEAMEVPELPVD